MFLTDSVNKYVYEGEPCAVRAMSRAVNKSACHRKGKATLIYIFIHDNGSGK